MILLHGRKKIKRRKAFLLYLNCFLSFLFALGIIKIFPISAKAPEVTIIESDLQTVVQEAQKFLFGSINSKTYYNIGCKKGNSISDKNKIWFSGPGEAERAGYGPSKYCNFSAPIDF